ncbi:serine/threonine receptor-like kinase NFP [Magnolia sinica]|uniref:serine/threonine receptor-like kinase NFP n=1 Tax=Magnolia sinica TaxID=86752 RepID=UPI0026592722|nr:serine/threonine receptor-like kinase NFP [Magnolia sinica]
MARKPYLSISSLPLLLLLLHQTQSQPSITGYTCSLNQSNHPCQTYVFYRATVPDLVTIADLFGVSRLSISKSSNISSPSSPLIPDQNLLIPITCSCNSNLSSFNTSYQIQSGDTFYLLSTYQFQNLTTYQAVQVANPSLVPTNLQIGVDVIFPIFCQCPNKTQLGNNIKYLITYVFQPSDTLDSVATKLGSDVRSLVALNGEKPPIFSTILVPVSRIPLLKQPLALPSPSTPTPSPSTPTPCGRKGVVVKLAIGLGILGALLVVSIAVITWFWWVLLKRRREGREDKEKGKKERFGSMSGEDFMADVSDCLDKYKVYGIEDVREATLDFDYTCLIQGSVYKGCIRDEVFAIKKMKWNAYEELKILQKVNHSNLVKLDGFCIDPTDGGCYLVYEYVENGSLHSWLHGYGHTKQLDWKARLQIAVDVASGLQYIHEHTRPSVVHKDINTSNILLDGSMRAKIANFGLAKSGCNAMTTNIVGTRGYLAPEYIADGIVTTKIDVFAFGVVLLELVSGNEAADSEGRAIWMDVDWIFKGEEVEREERLKGWMDGALVRQCCNMDGVMNVMAVARACLQREAAKRPSMVDIVYMLCKADELFFDFSEDGLPIPSRVMAR